MPSLSKITFDAFAWRLLTEASRLTLALGVQVILARLLPVEAFGMLAAAMLVVSLGSRLAEMGTAPAVIQRENLTPTHVRVAFSLSLVTGTLLTAVIWFGAQPMAAVFHTPGVAPVVRLVGLVFVVGSFGTTAEALLQRAMDYRRLVKVEVISYGLGFAVVGVPVASLGYGVWALAWATLAQAAVKSAMLVLMRPHPMRFCLAKSETRELLDFGIGISLGRLAAFAAQNGDAFVVARWLGASALGLYSRAYQLMCLPINEFSSLLNGVLFPAYSSIQSDTARLRRGYLVSLSVSAMVVFPVLTTIGLTAPELMVGVFGSQWAGAARPLQILCVGGAGYCIYNLADSLVRAKGAVFVKFFYHSVYAVCVFAAAVVGQRWGITGVSIGVVLAIGVVYLLMAHLSLKLLDCSWTRFFFAQWSAVVVSCAAAGAGLPVVIALRHAGLPPLAILAGAGAISLAAALAAALLLPSRWLIPTIVPLVEVLRNAVRHPFAWGELLAQVSPVRHELPRPSPLR